METIEVGPFEFHDKMALKTNYKELGVRVVPHAIARYGAYVASGVIMMPSYINIGAFVDSGTMVDTWATVGKLCTNWKKCAFKRRSWNWRSIRTTSGRTRNYRGWSLYRFTLYCC